MHHKDKCVCGHARYQHIKIDSKTKPCSHGFIYGKDDPRCFCLKFKLKKRYAGENIFGIKVEKV